MSNKPLGLHPEDPSVFDTYTGKVVSAINFTEDMIDIKDIAHSLSLQCRFNGHVREFYSVADHSLFVSNIVEVDYKYSSDRSQYMTVYAALLHDASEAYLPDIPRPTKYSIKGLKEIENKIQGVIVKHFNIVGPEWSNIHEADELALSTEADQLMITQGKGWSGLPIPLNYKFRLMFPKEAEAQFLSRFYWLKEKLGI
jgi:hypothetical protein